VPEPLPFLLVPILFLKYGRRMEEASPDDVAQSLAFALLYTGRKRARDADTMMADIVAKRLVEHLQRSGFVITKLPPGPGPTTPVIR
jgi:hypothetical protein